MGSNESVFFVKWHFLVGSIVWWKKFDAFEAAVTTFTGADDDDVDYDLDSDRTCALTATNHTNISTRWTMELNANTSNRKKWMRVYMTLFEFCLFIFFLGQRDRYLSWLLFFSSLSLRCVIFFRESISMSLKNQFHLHYVSHILHINILTPFLNIYLKCI